MKYFKIITILICTVFFQKTQAQQAGSYITNNTMTAFHGTWQWAEGNDTLRIYLVTKKIFDNINGGFFWDRLVGWHIYKSGNMIIQSSYAYINNLNHYSFRGGNEINANVVEGFITDIKKNKDGDLTLALNSFQNQLTWKLVNSPGMRIRKPTDPPFDYSFSLPTNIVLTKL